MSRSITLIRMFSVILLLLSAMLYPPVFAQDAQSLDLYVEPGPSSMSRIWFTADGKNIVSLAYGDVALWDVESGRELESMSTQAASTDGRTIAFVPSEEESIILWDVRSWGKRQTLSWDGGRNPNIFFSDLGTICSWSPTTLATWDQKSGRVLVYLKFPAGGSDAVFSPNGRIVAWRTKTKITLLDMASGNEIHSIDGVWDSVTFSPDGKTIASSNGLGLTLWDVTSGVKLNTIPRSPYDRPPTFSPDGKLVAVQYIDQLRLWSVGSGQELIGFEGRYIGGVTFSPDGKFLALDFSRDKTIALWETGSMHQPRTLKARESCCSQSVNFLPDGKTLVIGEGKQQDAPLSSPITRASLWNVASGSEIKIFEGSSSLAFFPDRKTAASWVPGGKTISVWDSSSWSRLALLSSEFEIFNVGFTPKGELTAWGQTKLTVWNQLSAPKHYSSTSLIGEQLELAYSSDGKTLAVLCGYERDRGGNSIGIWDVGLGKRRSTIKTRAFNAQFFALSPDGKSIATTNGHSNEIRLWDLAYQFQPRSITLADDVEPSIILSFFSPDGKTLALCPMMGGKTVELWDVASARKLLSLDPSPKGPGPIVFSPYGRTIAMWGGDVITLFDVITGEKRLLIREFGGGAFSFSSDGKKIAYQTSDNRIRILDLSSGGIVRSAERQTGSVHAVAFDPANRLIASGSEDGTIKVWDVSSGKLLSTLEHGKWVDNVAFSSNGELIASQSLDGNIREWRTSSGDLIKSYSLEDSKPPSELNSIIPDLYKNYRIGLSPISQDWRLQVRPGIWPSPFAGRVGSLNLIDAMSGSPLATLSTLMEQEWVVTTPDGRFDTNKPLDQVEGLHWVVNGEVRNPLPLDIFIREYYQPHLLRRVLAGEQFTPLPSIATINRVQPKVAIEAIKPVRESSAEVRVTVENTAQNVTVSKTDPSKKKRYSSGVYDLRLFRDGQLVAYSTSDEKLQSTFHRYQTHDDEKKAWQVANKVDLVDGKNTFTFTVKLPANANKKEIEFSAYAFNEDRVKSETARLRWSPPEAAKPPATQPAVKPRAYVIAVGVNANENPAFDLQFAANDARRFQEVLPQRLAATGEYSEVVAVSLISDWEMRRGQKVATKRDATKANFKAVLDLLAGRPVADEIKRGIPNAEKLARTTPDDLVLILFSSHGYADQSGNFYFIPYDTGPGSCSVFTETVRQRSISSDELSLWLRDVDAGQMTLIVDACYSTAAIEGSGFKPGPMGSRGLGQLAYDKRMRILTATQADNVAVELPATAEGRPINHGLLSYALLEDGLGGNKADFKPQDKTIFMDEWLEYAVAEVPKLFASQPRPANETRPQSKLRNDRPRLVLLKRELSDPGVCGTGPSAGPSRIQEQQPSLFDFTRRKREVPLVRNP
jgi:WD40 repeat protein